MPEHVVFQELPNVVLKRCLSQIPDQCPPASQRVLSGTCRPGLVKIEQGSGTAEFVYKHPGPTPLGILGGQKRRGAFMQPWREGNGTRTLFIPVEPDFQTRRFSSPGKGTHRFKGMWETTDGRGSTRIVDDVRFDSWIPKPIRDPPCRSVV